MNAENALPPSLTVFMDDRLIGTLHNENPLAFSYAPAWLANPTATPIEPKIPLTAEKINTPYVLAFFENLLPEGEQRKRLSLRQHVSTIFGMLAAVGGDTAGSLVLLSVGQQTPQPPRYRAMTWAQINQLLHGDHNDNNPPIDPAPRLTLSGAQLKMLISLDADGNPLLPLGNSPSTHILKPDMIRGNSKLFATAVNETIVMRTAHLCDLPTAHVAYQAPASACLVERYDRVRDSNGTLNRLWQADFCQLAGKPSDCKYEADGGPTFKDCFDLLTAHSVCPALDQRNLLRWLFFNLYVGNNDTHAKNIAILNTPAGLRLAPFYDLLSTRVYSGLGPHFAFSIGGEFSPGKITHAHLVRLALTLGVGEKYLLTIAHEMANRVEAAIPLAVEELRPKLTATEKVLADRLLQRILSITQKMRHRILPPAAEGV